MSRTVYALDTNVLVHDPNSPLNFEEHLVLIPMTVLEELDHLKVAKQSVAADARQAIRQIDALIGGAELEVVVTGVPIMRASGASGSIAVLLPMKDAVALLDSSLNDNIIINQVLAYQQRHPEDHVVLVTKDINMRLKARVCGLEAQDYQSDKAVDDIDLLPSGFHEVAGSFWESFECRVDTVRHEDGHLTHQAVGEIPEGLYAGQFIIDELSFCAKVLDVTADSLLLLELPFNKLMHQEAWGLRPRDIYQALALYALLDPDTDIVTLTGAAGSGKTILALAAAIEQTMVSKRYSRIIATRSVQGLDEDIGFLPGTETEKMLPWLGAITDNLEALHAEDEDGQSSIDYILQRVPLQFKSLNFIRGRSFQHTLLIIDECQNLTPHQMKTIITRAGNGTKVVCLGNLAQIDTPYLSAPSSGLTYLVERFKGFSHGASITLQGVPRSALAEYAERKL